MRPLTQNSLLRREAAVIAGAALLLALCCCESKTGDTSTSGTNSPETPVVHAVNYPLAYFASRIGGEDVDVRFIAPAGGDPAFWMPSDEDIVALQSADLVLLNGAGYAKWRSFTSLAESRTHDTSVAFAGDFISLPDAGSHSHGSDGEHSHGGMAFTTWLDIRQASMHAEAVRVALTALVPGAEPEIEARAIALHKDLETLDDELLAACESLADRPLVASHPVYQYLARRYHLQIESVHWEPESVPDAAAIAELDEILARHPASLMLWEGDPADESIALLRERGIESVVFDPCGNRPGSGDWLSVMRSNTARLREIDG